MCFKNVFLLVFLLANINIGLANDIIVDSSHGKIAGKTLKTLLEKKTYYGFMGIPYAEVPIGDLRFLPPQPIEPWKNTLTATKEKKACVQFNVNIKKGQPFGQYGSEDCLYLDIYTPALDENKRPTIVFLHNTNFKNSYNKTKDYGPDFFIEEDTIVVTIAHRLTVFGFLSLEDDVLPGNAGLKDIVQGLEWYRNNAVKFGGDPEKITLLGSSGGAAAVDILIHSKAKHLFSSAILHSGTSFSPGYLQENVKERAIKLSELLEARSSNRRVLLENLKRINDDKLFFYQEQANPTDYFREHQRSINTFGPIVEKQENGLLTEYPENSSADIDIPVLIGYNSREGIDRAIEYLYDPKFLLFLNKDFPLIMPIRLPFEFDPTYEIYFEAAAEIKKYYFNKNKIKMSDASKYISYAGDVLVTYAVDYTAQHYANKSTNNVFYYYFDYYSELNENKNSIMKLSKVQEGTWGASTGDELCYLFMCPSLKDQYLRLHNAASETAKIQKKLVKMWTNFAKHGNPTPDDSVLEGQTWPKYNLETKQYLHIDNKFEVKDNLNKKSIQFWNNWINKWENYSKENKHDELYSLCYKY